MKKIVIITVIVLAIVGAIGGLVIYTKNQDRLEAEKNARDVVNSASDRQEIQEANQRRIEYNRSVGRPDNAN